MHGIAPLPRPHTTPTNKWEVMPGNAKHTLPQHLLGPDLCPETKHQSDYTYNTVFSKEAKMLGFVFSHHLLLSGMGS